MHVYILHVYMYGCVLHVYVSVRVEVHVHAYV